MRQWLGAVTHDCQLRLALYLVNQLVFLIETLGAWALQRLQAYEAIQWVILIAAQYFHWRR
ncbi:hypothetical protein TK06_02475 [Pseudomonas fluorescens]|uniref:Uncharacterized protein n=1 Tax=Pseudomonas fluorescens TaxID=294 RepID=A0A165YUL6_PSEFL|nr:hypothetical protein TK06_02475 [Pseudomonas fluorescens]